MTSPSASDIAAADKPAFQVAQIFLNRAAFTHRRPPLSLPADTKHAPQGIRVSMGLQNLSDGSASQVLVSVGTDPEDGDEKALYDWHVEMIAVVHDINRSLFPDQQLAEVVATMVFPFVRETIANITGRGRFGPVWVNPFNVRSAIREAFEQQEKAAETELESPTP